MNFDWKQYDDPADYFEFGDCTMVLTVKAAVEACGQAAEHGLIVVRVEGGAWQNLKFTPSLACIWDGGDPPVTAEQAHENNLNAAAFIELMSETYDPYIRGTFDAFILTDSPITGYPHKA